MTRLRTRGHSLCASTAILLISLVLSGCAGGEGGDGGVAEAPAYTSPLSVTLGWEPVQDHAVSGYVIHYGTNSPHSSGSCNYENALFVSGPEGTVMNLYPETRYYFSVSAYNGVESSCSSEVSTVTPPLPA